MMIINNHEIYRRGDGRVVARKLSENGAGEERIIQLARCFPWTHEGKYFSLRNERGREVALLEDIDQLEDPAVRDALLADLEQRTHVPRIRRIEAIEDEIDLFRWRVHTDAGYRVFYTRRREVPRELPNGGAILKDISSDRYFIPNMEQLDARSRNFLWLYLD